MSSVKTGICKGVMHVVLHRPECRNSLTTQMCSLLCEALDRAAQDEAVKVVMLSGTAGNFTAGADPQDFAMHSGEDAHAMVLQFIDRMSTFPKPLVAAVEGLAAGIGVVVLHHCDVVYAADDALFDPGPARESRSTKTSLRASFVTQVLPPGDLLYYAARQAERLAQLPSGTMARTQSLIG